MAGRDRNSARLLTVITGFKNRYLGQTIYVFGSGKSLDFFPKEFFDDKICVATNEVGHSYGLKNYISCGHHYEAGELYRAIGIEAPIVTPDRDTTKLEMAPLPDGANVFRFPASRQHFHRFDVRIHWPTNPDTLVVGSSGLHSAMHLAHYMGAATIVLVGVDMGTLDGHTNFDAYLQRPVVDKVRGAQTEHSWVAWEQHTRDVANKLRELGSNVISLSPFINPNLEGHEYRGVCAIN
jgi:hypothetical protein